VSQLRRRGEQLSGDPILIVDDNSSNLELMGDLLDASGYDVRRALDANEALATLHDFRPRLILMDIQLPGMDGLTLTRMLKSNPSKRHIIILGLTGYAMPGDAERVLAAGCDGYIQKPIDTRALPGVIQSYLHPPAPVRDQL
jgi:two-component system cell cycle response regulator DivK